MAIVYRTIKLGFLPKQRKRSGGIGGQNIFSVYETSKKRYDGIKITHQWVRLLLNKEDFKNFVVGKFKPENIQTNMAARSTWKKNQLATNAL